MKITTQTFDLFDAFISIFNWLYENCFKGEEKNKLSQQDAIDYDFVAGQIGKLILFLIQIIYYLDFQNIDPLQITLMVQGYLYFVIFMVVVESKYIYQGHSYTFHRIIANRLMNLAVNLISFYIIDLNSSLLNNLENMKNFRIGVPEFLIVTLAFFTVMETIELLVQLCTGVFPCLKQFDNTEEFDSSGGCGYLSIGQFFGMLVAEGGAILIFYLQNIPIESLLSVQILPIQIFAWLEFFIFLHFNWNRGKNQQEATRSKKVLCFGYGFFIGLMAIISIPLLMVVAIVFIIIYVICMIFFGCCCKFFQCKCCICCIFPKDKSHVTVPVNNNED